jgi:hypothetical protein
VEDGRTDSTGNTVDERFDAAPDGVFDAGKRLLDRLALRVAARKRGS